MGVSLLTYATFETRTGGQPESAAGELIIPPDDALTIAVNRLDALPELCLSHAANTPGARSWQPSQRECSKPSSGAWRTLRGADRLWTGRAT
jgi:hypothetical protein